MANESNGGGRRWSRWRIAGWGLAASILLLPLAAMQFTNEVNWDETDFIFAGVLIGTVGIAYEVAVRMSGSIAYRCGAAAALLAGFLIVWANGAVGMIGSEDNSFNLLFLGVILLALAGSVAARFRPGGMAIATGLAAAVHAAVALAGMAADLRGGIFSLSFAGIWLFAAVLFRAAAHERRPGDAAA